MAGPRLTRRRRQNAGLAACAQAIEPSVSFVIPAMREQERAAPERRYAYPISRWFPAAVKARAEVRELQNPSFRTVPGFTPSPRQSRNGMPNGPACSAPDGPFIAVPVLAEAFPQRLKFSVLF
jgi:hypothetical protein